ncbi:MAG TPA: glutathione S-transferase family protein [Steroidobacteraceae bacterium]|nr:glutathione S-transferase family protein [Steroidobacteraceae bacterium]
MLKVYGIDRSRAARTIWLCRELGLKYEQVQVNFADANTKTPEFLAVNPSGKIPAIDDDGFHLSESMAINIYLAKKHGSALMPKELRDEAKLLQWSFWVMTEIEKPLLNVMLQRMPPLPDPQAEKYFRERNPRNAEVEKTSVETLQKPLAYLNDQLAKRDYLLGKEFMLADLNVASVMTWAIRAKLDMSAFPNVQRWLTTCLARPAAK